MVVPVSLAMVFGRESYCLHCLYILFIYLGWVGGGDDLLVASVEEPAIGIVSIIKQ